MVFPIKLLSPFSSTFVVNLGFVLLLLMSPASLHARESIIFSYGNYQSEPYVILNGEAKIVGGIMYKIGTVLAKYVPYDLKFRELPRNRMEDYLARGLVDLRCHLSPFWVEDKGLYLWTEKLYKLETILVSKSSVVETIREIDQVDGTSIVIIDGYRYSDAIRSKISNNVIRVESTESLESGIKMVLYGRADYVLGNNILANYLIHKNEQVKEVKIHPVNVRTVSVHCAVSKNTKLDSGLILEALEKMLEDKRFQPILDSHLDSM